MHNDHTELRTVLNQDGAAILDIRNNSISTLNPVGAYVWQRLQQRNAIDAVIADLVRDTGEDPALVQRDVEAFLEDLKTHRLWPR